MVIRTGVIADAKRLAWVHGKVWLQAYTDLLPPDYLVPHAAELSTRADKWRAWVSTRPPWVAETERGELVGFSAWGGARDADVTVGITGELLTIYVLAEHWGFGVGRMLMAASLASMREAGFLDAVLWVLEGNVRARRFYEAGGWHPDGAVKTEERGGVVLHEVRYRLRLA